MQATPYLDLGIFPVGKIRLFLKAENARTGHTSSWTSLTTFPPQIPCIRIVQPNLPHQTDHTFTA